MIDLPTVGDRLRFAREQRGLLQRDVAEALGMKTTVQISQWEANDYRPSAKHLPGLTKVLGTTAEWILSGTGNPPVKETVPRGTSPNGSGRHGERLRRATALEREMLRSGALDEDADYIRLRARSYMESVLSSGGTELKLSDDELDAEFDAYLENLRAQIEKRIKLRRKSGR